jgi:hypothetical protein
VGHAPLHLDVEIALDFFIQFLLDAVAMQNAADQMCNARRPLHAISSPARALD